jgi:hypothetical protein
MVPCRRVSGRRRTSPPAVSSTMTRPAPVAAPMAADGRSNPLGSSATGRGSAVG